MLSIPRRKAEQFLRSNGPVICMLNGQCRAELMSSRMHKAHHHVHLLTTRTPELLKAIPIRMANSDRRSVLEFGGATITLD